MAPSVELLRLTAHEIQVHLSSGRLETVDLVEAYTKQIRDHNA